MDKMYKDILNNVRESIIEDVDVENGILSPLERESILSSEDIQSIRQGKTKQHQAEILIELLSGRGRNAFYVLKEALKPMYKWISSEIDKELKAYKSSTNTVDYCPVSIHLPPLLPSTVSREEKIKQLEGALRNLKPKGYVALHGMKGYGKSCLAGTILSDEKLVADLFNNKIYWIKFGSERQTDQEILIQLNLLYHRIQNLEILPNTVTSESLKDSLIHFFKQHFNKSENQKALLILDDVCSKKIIDVFDFNCKTLVLTADLNIFDGRSYDIVKMNNGFSLKETLGLFSKVLDIQIPELPSEAQKIHEECKGMPLLISMFAAQFKEWKEDMTNENGKDRWKYYLNCLKLRDDRNTVIRKFFEKQNAIFDMCIEKLNPSTRNYYEQLAIFSEDVNIMPETLHILWDIPYDQRFLGEDIMLDLCRRSLAARQYNLKLRKYIYGVHDLLLCHLRRKLGEEKLRCLHKNFIEKYRNLCKGDFSKLPNDNYIYSYIGHHLEEAQLFEEFPNIYFDFGFLQTKLNSTGLSDLLIDLKKYRKYITRNGDMNHVNKLHDLETFLQEHASVIVDHRRKSCLDLTQIAMNHRYDGYISQRAKYLASKKKDLLYFQHDRKSVHFNIPLSDEISLTDEASTSCLDGSHAVLLGTTNGGIIHWDCEHKKAQIYHTGNTSAIKKIILSKENYQLLVVLNEEGEIKIFKLPEDEFEHHEKQIQSPRQKQFCWSEIFPESTPRDNSLKTLSIKNEIILDVTLSREDKIAACTNEGSIRVWDCNGNVLASYKDIKNCLGKIAFTANDQLLHVMDENFGVIITYNKSEEGYSYISKYNPQLDKKKVIFFCNIPGTENSLIIVTEYNAIQVKWFRGHDQIHSYLKQERARIEDRNVSYVCANITNDGQYLVLADSGGLITIWKMDTYEEKDVYKSHVTAIDTFLTDEGYHVICGSKEKVVHRWNFPQEKIVQSIKKSNYDAIIGNGENVDKIAKETFMNTVVILQGDSIVAESKPVDGKIFNLSFSTEGSKAFMITDKASLYSFDITTNKTEYISKLSQPTNFVKFMKLGDGCDDVLVYNQEENRLIVQVNDKVTCNVPIIGYLVSMYSINDKIVMTITQDNIVTFWNTSYSNAWCCAWEKIHCVKITENLNARVVQTSLSASKNYLIVILHNNTIILLKINQVSTKPPEIELYLEKSFEEKLSCCEISSNEIYAAIGFENGLISIIDIHKQEKTYNLFFHRTAVTQISWVPVDIKSPIFLSVTNDEIAWWNLSLNRSLENKRRSRTGNMSQSTSTPCFNNNPYDGSNISVSKSLTLEQISVQQDNYFVEQENEKSNKFWQMKVGKYIKCPGLLAVVPIPQNSTPRVCISSDFNKCLTSDMYGSINILSAIDFNDI